jgi:hypothetical protein
MIRKENEMVSEISVSDFPHNRYEALEESRRLLGIAEPDFSSLLKIIGRAEYGTLDFSCGRLSISLSSCGDNEVHLNLGLGHGPIERSAEYKFQLSELGIQQKQRRLHDFGGE